MFKLLILIYVIFTGENQQPVLAPILVAPNLAIGDFTEIFCNIKRGSFPITFTWFHNNKEIIKNSKYRVSNSETSSHLSIGKIQASDIGNYTCLVANNFGQDSGTVSVIIEGMLLFL